MSKKFYKYAGKTIYTGKESAGKSTMLSKHAFHIVVRNAQWKAKHSIDRPLVTNLPLSDTFIKFAESLGVDIFAWNKVEDLPKLRGCDLLIDEIGTYFPKEPYEWKDVPQNVKRWLPQSEKLGVHIYGTAQDYGQVNKDFRRLVKQLYEVRQIFGPQRPSENLPYKPKIILGLLSIHKLDQNNFEGEQFSMKQITVIPWYKFYNSKTTARFDTTKMVIESPPAPLRHVKRVCNDCGHEQVRHI